MPQFHSHHRYVTIALSACLAVLPALSTTARADAEVVEIEVKTKKSALEKVSGVALVSVYGDYKVRGSKILDAPGKHEPLEAIAQNRTEVLKASLVASGLLPFDLLDEGTVLQSDAYKGIIEARLQESAQPSGEEVVYEVLQVFGSKAESPNAKKERLGMTPVEFSREGYFVPPVFGVYQVPALNTQFRTWGAATKQREKLFGEMGASAILAANVEFAAVGLGGNVFGKESGRVMVTISGALIMPDGSMPYTFYVQAQSDKETLFRSPNAGIFEQQREFVQDSAVEMSEAAWDAAWGALQTRMGTVMEKLAKS